MAITGKNTANLRNPKYTEVSEIVDDYMAIPIDQRKAAREVLRDNKAAYNILVRQKVAYEKKLQQLDDFHELNVYIMQQNYEFEQRLQFLEQQEQEELSEALSDELKVDRARAQARAEDHAEINAEEKEKALEAEKHRAKARELDKIKENQHKLEVEWHSLEELQKKSQAKRDQQRNKILNIKHTIDVHVLRLALLRDELDQHSKQIHERREHLARQAEPLNQARAKLAQETMKLEVIASQLQDARQGLQADKRMLVGIKAKMAASSLAGQTANLALLAQEKAQLERTIGVKTDQVKGLREAYQLQHVRHQKAESHYMELNQRYVQDEADVRLIEGAMRGLHNQIQAGDALVGKRQAALQTRTEKYEKRWQAEDDHFTKQKQLLLDRLQLLEKQLGTLQPATPDLSSNLDRVRQDYSHQAVSSRGEGRSMVPGRDYQALSASLSSLRQSLEQGPSPDETAPKPKTQL